MDERIASRFYSPFFHAFYVYDTRVGKPWDLNRCPVAWESRWWTRNCSIKRTDSRQFPIRRDTDADCSIRRDWIAPRRTWSPILERTLPERTARSRSLMDSWRRRVAPDVWLAPAKNFILISRFNLTSRSSYKNWRYEYLKKNIHSFMCKIYTMSPRKN